MARRTAAAADGHAAIGYVRVSTQEQAEEGISLDAQEARTRAYCMLRGLDLLEVVVDAAVSAGKYTLEARDGGARVLAAVKQGRIRHVVAMKLDRLFRDAEDALHQTKAWDKAGIALHLIDLGGASIDTSSAVGRMFLTMMAGMAEWERNVIAERTKAALSRKAEKGERVGAVPFGKMVAPDGVHLINNPAEQTIIAIVCEPRAAALSLRDIAAALNRRGLTNRVGGTFNHGQVARMLEAA